MMSWVRLIQSKSLVLKITKIVQNSFNIHPFGDKVGLHFQDQPGETDMHGRAPQ